MQRTTLVTAGFLGLLGGLAASRWLLLSTWLLVLCVTAPSAIVKKSRLVIFAVVLCGGSVGLWRGQMFKTKADVYQKLYHKHVVMSGWADSDAVYVDHGQLSFDLTHLTLMQPHNQTLVGRVKVAGLGASMVYRGDQVQFSGSLSQTKGSAQAKTSYAKIIVTARAHSPIDALRRRFVTGLLSTLPEPEASFGAGLLLGQRSTIPKETNDQLSATGLTHLVAVSGYNLTIIILAVRRLIGKASKFQSTSVAGLLIVLFVLLTGLSASIVRAALVSGLSLAAWHYGRRFKPALLISFAAATTAFWNPFYLWSDIGWYLSFLAFFGVLIVAPVVSTVISPSGKPKTVGSLIAETTSAQLMTLPIIMYTFGRLSLIGLLANILVVPLVPLGMLLSLLAGVGGMVSPILGGWLALPARLLLTYMIDITGLLSRLPRASVEQYISVAQMVALYVIIMIVSLILWRKKSRHKDRNMLE